MDKPTENGPDLPEEFYYHCMTNFNETLVLVLGGYSTAKSNLLVDVSSKVTQGFEFGFGFELEFQFGFKLCLRFFCYFSLLHSILRNSK